MEFQATDLPTASVETTHNTSVFTIDEEDLFDGAWPRLDVTLAITLSKLLLPDDHGLVSVHVNDKALLMVRVSPKIANSDQSSWFAPTLLTADEGEFVDETVVLKLSNCLQEDSLKTGENSLGIAVNNVNGSRIKAAALLSPTELVIDARSPYLLTLGVVADEDPWTVDSESIVEAVVESQGGCALENVIIDINWVAGASFEKRPAEPLEPVPYEGSPIVARFGLTPTEIGPFEAVVTAGADRQDPVLSIITRTSGEPKSSRIDANNLIGYIVFGALSAVGTWLLFTKRRAPHGGERSTVGE